MSTPVRIWLTVIVWDPSRPDVNPSVKGHTQDPVKVQGYIDHLRKVKPHLKYVVAPIGPATHAALLTDFGLPTEAELPEVDMLALARAQRRMREEKENSDVVS